MARVSNSVENFVMAAAHDRAMQFCDTIKGVSSSKEAPECVMRDPEFLPRWDKMMDAVARSDEQVMATCYTSGFMECFNWMTQVSDMLATLNGKGPSDHEDSQDSAPSCLNGVIPMMVKMG